MLKRIFISLLLVAGISVQSVNAQSTKPKSAPAAAPATHSSSAAPSNETIALKGGSSSSHVAMLARSRGVPMVIGLGEAWPAASGPRA